MPAKPAAARESAAPMGPVLSVSALNRSVRDLIEHRFPLVLVAGEISNLLVARSGHLYFSLKDDQAQVRCVMFRGRSALLDWQPRDGAQVEVRALVTLYEPRGDFQLNVDYMRRAGLGALYEAFLRLKERLESEGLFDLASKRELPAFPRAIGVVTSSAAAALRDVLTTLARRNPAIPVVIYPTAVQGEAAPAEIAAALGRAAHRGEVDVLILCRGGGSIEDLWAFNDERVARAIRRCPIPIVVGVGHETDVTIADFAADRRAPTPTAAAELVSPARAELIERVAALAARVRRSTARTLDTRSQRLDHATARLVHPGRRLDAQAGLLLQLRLRLAHAAARGLERRTWVVREMLERVRRPPPELVTASLRAAQYEQRVRLAISRRLGERAVRLDALERGLGHLDPRAVLGRGYAIATDVGGAIVDDAARLQPGDLLRVVFARGSAATRVESTAPDGPPAPTPS